MIPRLVREAALVLVALTLLMGTAFAYTGTWPPAVIVESSSMMHADDEVPYGRFGTLDPGDLVLVKAVDDVAEVHTLLDGGRASYAAAGDVLIFRPAGDPDATPIIHRAVAYVERVDAEEGPTFRVRWDSGAPCAAGATKEGAWCVFGPEGILLPEHGIVHPDGSPYKPNASGFITKGDNPFTNRLADPIARISRDAEGRPAVVDPSWVEGVSRGEVPWLGLVKLSLAPQPNEQAPPPTYVRVGSAYAPPDLWVMLAVTLAVLIGAPFVFDALLARLRQAGPEEPI